MRDMDIASLRELALKATPGPWVHDNNEGYGADNVWERGSPTGHGYPGQLVAQAVGDDARSEDNAAFIAACDPQTIDRLCAALALAINMLSTYEPGDSRAVSDEFVALAAVQCGLADDKSDATIRAALAARLAQHEDAG